jgi:hypothetical protein
VTDCKAKPTPENLANEQREHMRKLLREIPLLPDKEVGWSLGFPVDYPNPETKEVPRTEPTAEELRLAHCVRRLEVRCDHCGRVAFFQYWAQPHAPICGPCVIKEARRE